MWSADPPAATNTDPAKTGRRKPLDDRVSISLFRPPPGCCGCDVGAIRARSADAIAGPARRLAQAGRARQTPRIDLRIQDARRATGHVPRARLHARARLMGPRRRRERSVHSSPSRSVAVCRWLLRWLLARHCCPASMCAWTCGNVVSAWVWLIHWLLGLETAGLRKLGLGL